MQVPGRFVVLSVLVCLSSLQSMPARACSDFADCTDTVENCGGRISGYPFLTPLNDTRMNLALILEAEGKTCLNKSENDLRANPPAPGRTTLLKNGPAEAVAMSGAASGQAAAPEGSPAAGDSSGQVADDEALMGGRCATNTRATAALFANQVRESGIPGADARALAAVRESMLGKCGEQQSPLDFSAVMHKTGQAHLFAMYLQAANDFYAGRFEQAGTGFTQLSTSAGGWLAETATYMLIRVSISNAQVTPNDSWGTPEWTQLGVADARLAEKRLANYLKLYPDGRYAASARGLRRRVLWLEGDDARLQAEYRRALTVADKGEATRLIYEIDHFLIMAKPGFYSRKWPDLYLVSKLYDIRVRQKLSPEMLSFMPKVPAPALPDPAGIAWKQKPEWFNFLRLTQRFSEDHDFAAVVSAIAPPKPGEALDLVGFSTQVMRAHALMAQQKWGQAEADWQTLLTGETSPSRRHFLATALLLTQQFGSKFDVIFSENALLGADTALRQRMLPVAPAAILRKVIADGQDSAAERMAAMTILLEKDLLRQHFADLLADNQLGSAAIGPLPLTHDTAAVPHSEWALNGSEYVLEAPDNKGRWAPVSMETGCPDLDSALKTLVLHPDEAQALNCIGDFVRVFAVPTYSLDGFFATTFNSVLFLDEATSARLMGDRFDGSGSALDYYQAVIANQQAPAAERARALSRAINCFSPSGYSHCGGADVPPTTRAKWFQTLKRQYRTSSWAKRQVYYW